MICQDQGENLFKGHHANNLDEEAELQRRNLLNESKNELDEAEKKVNTRVYTSFLKGGQEQIAYAFGKIWAASCLMD